MTDATIPAEIVDQCLDAAGYGESLRPALRRALAALPPVALAVLRGEAVAVPVEPTVEMVAAGEACDRPAAEYSGYAVEHASAENHYRAMIAASPFAQEPQR